MNAWAEEDLTIKNAKMKRGNFDDPRHLDDESEGAEFFRVVVETAD